MSPPYDSNFSEVRAVASSAFFCKVRNLVSFLKAWQPLRLFTSETWLISIWILLPGPNSYSSEGSALTLCWSWCCVCFSEFRLQLCLPGKHATPSTWRDGENKVEIIFYVRTTLYKVIHQTTPHDVSYIMNANTLYIDDTGPYWIHCNEKVICDFLTCLSRCYNVAFHHRLLFCYAKKRNERRI